MIHATYFNTLWGLSALAICLLRCFFLPYIWALICIVLNIIHLISLRRKHIPLKKQFIAFIALTIPCIMGLAVLEPVFLAMMGI